MVTVVKPVVKVTELHWLSEQADVIIVVVEISAGDEVDRETTSLEAETIPVEEAYKAELLVD